MLCTLGISLPACIGPLARTIQVVGPAASRFINHCCRLHYADAPHNGMPRGDGGLHSGEEGSSSPKCYRTIGDDNEDIL